MSDDRLNFKMNMDLKFLKSWRAYNAGEVARFSKSVALNLVDKGIAIEHKPQPLSATRIEGAMPKGARAARAPTGAREPALRDPVSPETPPAESSAQPSAQAPDGKAGTPVAGELNAGMQQGGALNGPVH